MDIPRPPSEGRLWRESRALLELPRLALRAPALARAPRAAREPVLVVPGFATGDGSTLVLRRFLRLKGYDARGWGMGRNRGNVKALVPRVIDATARLADQRGQAVRLIGWSLGGVLARETARERPDLVDQVVTLGTPVIGGPKYTAVGPLYEKRGYDLDEIEAQVAERNRIPIEVPVTAIYSRADAVVAWQACFDHHSPRVEHVEVGTTHAGLGFSPEVFGLVAERLAPR